MPTCTAQIRTLRICAVLVFAGCSGGPANDTAAAHVEPTPPSLVDVTVVCDAQDARWHFAATTDAWTGNGQVWLSTDGTYVEKHALNSKTAAADGSSDTLDLTLRVESDWRDVVLGASTVFNCNEADLTGIVRVWERDGVSEADCRAFGSSPERWEAWSAGTSCAEVLTSEAR